MAVKIEVKGQIMSNDIAQVYHYFGWDACCPKDISAKLGEAAGGEVILEINSPQGKLQHMLLLQPQRRHFLSVPLMRHLHLIHVYSWCTTHKAGQVVITGTCRHPQKR